MNTLPALVHFLHQACFSPVIYTWFKAINKGFFATCPVPTSILVHKHLPKSIDTEKSHLIMARQHVRSTRTQYPPPPTPPTQTIHQPIMTVGILHMDNSALENLACMRPVEVSDHIFSDQTGRLPRVSSRGNRSVMVLYDYDSKNILTEPLKYQTTQELVRAQTRLIQYLLERGLKLTTLRIDKKCPKTLQRFFRANSVDLRILPPKNQHTNQAEKAIDT